MLVINIGDTVNQKASSLRTKLMDGNPHGRGRKIEMQRLRPSGHAG